MTENQQSITLRIQLLEKISVIDLPSFLFKEIDTALSLLNYYKLTNLVNNSEEYCSFLQTMSHEYIETMLAHTHKKVSKQGMYTNPVQFMTSELSSTGTDIYMTKKELVIVESTFRVNCLLRMKEYINRRVLQKKVRKI